MRMTCALESSGKHVHYLPMGDSDQKVIFVT